MSYNGQYKLNLPNGQNFDKKAKGSSRREILSNYVSEARTEKQYESTLKKHSYNDGYQDNDTFVDQQYREQSAFPVKYPDLFSFAAERIEYYDELVEDIGEFLVEAVNLQEMYYGAVDDKRENNIELDEILVRFGFDIQKGANDIGSNSKRIRYTRELFQTIGKYFN